MDDVAKARTVGPSYLGPALIGYFGLVALAHTWIPCDLGCKGETTVGLLHNVTGLTGFVATALGMLVLARRWRTDPTWQSHTGFTWRAVSFAAAGLIWFVITQAADLQPLAGLAQRTFSGALLLWIAATAWKLHRLLRPDPSGDFVAGVATPR